jgi:inhibitor of KinA sporulation pathway (predicted exonuclease)
MKTDQPFDFLVVLDFEATCDDHNPPSPQEIIEFPSVLISMDTLAPVSEFRAFVKPQHHSRLTRFCMELTGIRQEQIDRAPSFPEVLKQHLDWLRAHRLPVETDETGHQYALVLCGDWDLGTMFPLQGRVCVPPLDRIPRPYRQWVNIKRLYAKWKGVAKTPGLRGMLRGLGMSLEGHHHCGIDDCRNIARIVKALVERGQAMEITSRISKSRHPPVSLAVSMDNQPRCSLMLEKRSLEALLGAASGVFGCHVVRAFHANGRELALDEHVFDLKSNTEIIVTDGRDFY